MELKTRSIIDETHARQILRENRVTVEVEERDTYPLIVHRLGHCVIDGMVCVYCVDYQESNTEVAV